ncbi:MAG: Membrane-associated zinc metalloprotease [Nitrospira sp.]|nr:MAG: Membrane-associated zinc metalloprotease [Nitrospira sp.]
MGTAFAWSPDFVSLLTHWAIPFLVVLGVLVAFHEMGHFLAARWVGVKVLKFSLGFGPKVFGRQVGETEYLLSAVPLGGYVKLFGEDEQETITSEEKKRAFAHQSLWGKTLIVAAGPIFNFILAYLIYTAYLGLGYTLPVPSFKDIIPEIEAVLPGSPADQAGLKPGDRVIRVNEKEISTSAELLKYIAQSNGKQLTLDFTRGEQVKTTLVTPGKTAVQDNGKATTVYQLGIEERAPVITAVIPGSRAQAAGLSAGDRVVRIDGHDIFTWSQMTTLVRESPNRALQFDIQRNGAAQSLAVTPLGEKTTVDGKTVEIGKIGISAQNQTILQTNDPLKAPWLGAQATWSWTELTVVGIYKIITGEISRKNIGGPLTIAKTAGDAAEQGTSNLVFLMAMLSINLGVLNLLPIPILDGGHLLFFFIEAIRRKPLEDRQRELAQQVGLVLLVGIMIFAFWNDIERLISP